MFESWHMRSRMALIWILYHDIAIWTIQKCTERGFYFPKHYYFLKLTNYSPRYNCLNGAQFRDFSRFFVIWGRKKQENPLKAVLEIHWKYSYLPWNEPVTLQKSVWGGFKIARISTPDVGFQRGAHHWKANQVMFRKHCFFSHSSQSRFKFRTVLQKTLPRFKWIAEFVE